MSNNMTGGSDNEPQMEQKGDDFDEEHDFKTQQWSAKESEVAPEDKGKVVYLTFVLWGIGVLLPFNVIMACLDYYALTVSTHYW